MDILGLFVALASGVAGGKLASSATGRLQLETRGNTLSCLMGGLLGAQIIQQSMGLAPFGLNGGIDFGALAAQSAGGAVGGAALMLVVALLRAAVARKHQPAE